MKTNLKLAANMRLLTRDEQIEAIGNIVREFGYNASNDDVRGIADELDCGKHPYGAVAAHVADLYRPQLIPQTIG